MTEPPSRTSRIHQLEGGTWLPTSGVWPPQHPGPFNLEGRRRKGGRKPKPVTSAFGLFSPVPGALRGQEIKDARGGEAAAATLHEDLFSVKLNVHK